MKSKLNTKFLISLVIGLSIALLYMFVKDSSAPLPQEASSPEEQFRLIEVKNASNVHNTEILGQITPEQTINVSMEVSGKIDENNMALSAGKTFRKNDFLLKIERTEVLYKLLALRSNFKEVLISSLETIQEKFPNEVEKWKSYTNSINRISSFSELPQTTPEEDMLITELKIPVLYNQIRTVEKEAEKYFYLAPYDGIIINSKVQPSQMIDQHSTLLTIAKKNSFVIQSHLDIELAKQIQDNKERMNVISDGEVIGTAQYSMTKSLKDPSKLKVLFTTSVQESKYLNRIVELKPLHFQPGTWLPSSALSKDDEIVIFKDNQTYSTPVEVIEKTQDSVLLGGLPNHFFVVTK